LTSVKANYLFNRISPAWGAQLMAATQDGHFLAIDTPLGKDELLMVSMSGTETMSRLFEYELEMASEDSSIKIPDILGKNVTITMDMGDGAERHFNGVVSHFSQSGSSGRFTRYQASVKPWLWFLTRTADCRIFQEMTVPDIIKQVLQEHGYSGDLEDKMTGSYRTWTYCVQYRESDFNYLSRLMEQEGIYYYFSHDKGSHKLVLADSYSGHSTVSNYAEIPFYADPQGATRERDHISEWRVFQELQPTNYVLTDYDFERPKTDLETRSQVSRQHDKADFEVFDYPGEYTEHGDGDNYVSARIEEIQAGYERCEGAGNAKGLATGALFTLSGFERPDQDREYILCSTMFTMDTGFYETGAGGGAGADSFFQCSFTAIDAQTQYRAPRQTPKPVVQGPHTAVVVGPVGEEIWTDEYGRVKVQFHWDRLGTNDENSSCWMRVSHPWAGKNWGAVAIPRIGQEVIVSFLEGDPDKPVITGRFYNADNMPPFSLPGQAMVSGVKSNSTPGGGGYNEIALDDTSGNELIRVHGQKDMDSTIENDLREHVLNDRARDVTNNETVSIGVDQSFDIGSNQTGKVGVDQKLDVGANKDETIGVNNTLKIGANKDENIGSNSNIFVGAAKAETVILAKALSIGAAYQVTVGGAKNTTIVGMKSETVGISKSVEVLAGSSSENIGTSKSVEAGTNISADAGANISLKAASNITGKATKNVVLNADADFTAEGGKKGLISMGDELEIKCGKAKIVLKKNGDIKVNGKKISTDASNNIVLKGKKILQN